MNKRSKPTQLQVAAEIAALEACKSWAPRRNMWGEDNHRKIDLQIQYLKEEIDVTADEFVTDFSEAEQSAVNEAQNWREGDEKETPSSGWDNFKPKTKKTK